ncbi:FAD-binding protein [Streptomyces sp. UG1]|uniref:FAD-binding oxidoreductase n=1 Tax=Streptomyces sp. UG1 TaxID=3417652 RepID=UPI003CF370FC
MVTRLRPTTLAEVRDAVRDGPPRLLIAGSGTAAEWGGTPSPHDAVLDVTGLDGVLTYQPSDLTVAVKAGTPLAALQEVLAENGQQVGLDAARIPRGATVGGLLATADGGPARHAYGTLRDCVIGITVVLADGTVARSGGQVIKNVAGYDLAKLFHGSLGTLGVIAEVTLRLHPLAEASCTVAAACTPGRSLELADRMMREALEPVALEWYDGRLLARFDGSRAGVARRARAAGFDQADPSVWQAVAAVSLGEPGDTVFRLGTLPGLWPWVADLVGALTGCRPGPQQQCRGRDSYGAAGGRQPRGVAPAAGGNRWPGRQHGRSAPWGGHAGVGPAAGIRGRDAGRQAAVRPVGPLRRRKVHPMDLNSFDETNPPRRELLDDCVHCGFCLPSCPTYLLDGRRWTRPVAVST